MTPTVTDAHPSRTLLLLDDEPNILNALQRALRRDGYRILASDDPLKALEILAEEKVDVILSDQRMPGMSGVEFLRRARQTHPETMRIVLSGYTDLQFITDAINEGAIYKFLTKPWDDALLRAHILEAFQHKEAADENLRLTQALLDANVALQAHVEEQARQAERIETALDTLHEVLQLIPWPVIGVDESGLIALANGAADAGLGGNAPLLGREARAALPEEIGRWLDAPAGMPEKLPMDGRFFHVIYKPMGRHSRSRGILLALPPCEMCP